MIQGIQERLLNSSKVTRAFMSQPPSVSLEVEVKDAASLFDDDASPTFPHSGRMMDSGLAEYLVDRTREVRRVPAVELAFKLRTAPMGEAQESELGSAVRTYFSNEEELAGLEWRINRAEGRAAFLYALPIVLLAGLAAGIFYLYGFVFSFFVTALFYLFFITIVWVMLWDPIEKYLFDAYLARLRREALQKLAKAQIRFAYAAT